MLDEVIRSSLPRFLLHRGAFVLQRFLLLFVVRDTLRPCKPTDMKLDKTSPNCKRMKNLASICSYGCTASQERCDANGSGPSSRSGTQGTLQCRLNQILKAFGW